MAKYKHNPDTLIVLNDLTNRVQQLIEVNELYLGQGHNDKMIEAQNTAFNSMLTILKQVKDNGHVFRGSSAVPDPIEPIVKTKWNNQTQLANQTNIVGGKNENTI